MTSLQTGETLVEGLQRFQSASEIQAGIREKNRLLEIEHLALPTGTERLRLRFTRVIKVKVVSYFLSAIAGIAVGLWVQSIERGVTGYDPVKREQLLQRKADRIERNGWSENANARQEKGKGDIGTLLNSSYASLKQVMTDPKRFIENTETYQSLLERYYNALKFIDDASFLIPAVLCFIMLGGYIGRKMGRIQDDMLEAEERERLRSKINELIDVANLLAEETARSSPLPTRSMIQQRLSMATQHGDDMPRA